MNRDHAFPVHLGSGHVFLRAGDRVAIRKGQAGRQLARVVGPGRKADTIRVERRSARTNRIQLVTVPATDLVQLVGPTPR